MDSASHRNSKLTGYDIILLKCALLMYCVHAILGNLCTLKNSKPFDKSTISFEYLREVGDFVYFCLHHIIESIFLCLSAAFVMASKGRGQLRKLRFWWRQQDGEEVSVGLSNRDIIWFQFLVKR